jgi:predicted transcriptional regulator
MPKTLTIQIKSADEPTEERREALTTVEAAGPLTRGDGVCFTSIEAVRNLLTPSRLALLRTIRNKRPGSIYELAKIVGRDLKNVQDDLRLLETYGLIRMTNATRSGKRRVRVPQAVFDHIALKIAI